MEAVAGGKLERANRVFAQGDWDQGGVTTVSLPKELAEKFLEGRGWTRDGDGRWVSYPDEHGTVQTSWETDEALSWELVGEALSR